ncbi:MAG: hypothetical protein CO096_32215, partial [Armatimonadetes bacterium CG_4_9_14_3_um_filter_66_14]
GLRSQPFQALGRVGPALLDLPVRPAPDPCHETERYLALAAVVAWRPASPKLALRLAGDDVAFAERFIRENRLTDCRPLLGVHPAAKWVSRRWLPDRMAAVADHAAQRLNAHVLFFGSRDEAAVVDNVRQRMRVPAVSVVGRTDLPQLASLVAACDTVVCHDSGPTHLGCRRPDRRVGASGSRSRRDGGCCRGGEGRLGSGPAAGPCPAGGGRGGGADKRTADSRGAGERASAGSVGGGRRDRRARGGHPRARNDRGRRSRQCHPHPQ